MASSTKAKDDGPLNNPASAGEVGNGSQSGESSLPLTSNHYGPMDDSDGPDDAEVQGDHPPVAKAKKRKKKKPKSKRGQVKLVYERVQLC